MFRYYYSTSGAGSRASAEQFVGSYGLVEFILVLVVTQLERVPLDH